MGFGLLLWALGSPGSAFPGLLGLSAALCPEFVPFGRFSWRFPAPCVPVPCFFVVAFYHKTEWPQGTIFQRSGYQTCVLISDAGREVFWKLIGTW